MPRRRPTDGSSLHQTIWDTVLLIPRGRVATYGEIARLSGMIAQARLVGYALHALPRGSDIPWHRVVNSQGRISLPKANGGFQRQKKLLRKEGIAFQRDRIDLQHYGWPNRRNTS